MKRACVVLVSIATLACSSTNIARAVPEAVASVSLKHISPAQGSVVNSATVISAEIDYSITNFNTNTEYYLAPLFDSSERAGSTFNEYDRLTDGMRITASSGTLKARHPIAKEWRSGKLAKPIHVRFFLMVRTGPQSTKVIGKSETVEFRVAG